LKPTAALIWLNGAAVQLVEVPGIIPGAAEDRGGGRALLGAVRNADAVLLIASLREPIEALAGVLGEVTTGVATTPGFLCLTGLDLPGAADRVAAFAGAYAQWPVVLCSTTTGAGLDDVRAALWSMFGLIRVWPHTGAARSDQAPTRPDGERPFILEQGASVRSLARLIHKKMAGRLRGARVWGPSAKFAAQQVGPEHLLADGDTVELLLRG
jgi:ribosome-interacting GTPase 1